MSDTTADTTARDTDATQAVTVATAAAALGITSDAVRARIRRGKLQAVKQENVWYVRMPAALLPQLGNGATTDATAPDSGATATGTDATEPDALILQLQDDNAWLRDQLDKALRTAERERERADVLQREALQRLEALTPGTVTPPEPQNRPESDETPPNGPNIEEPAGGFWGRLRALFRV